MANRVSREVSKDVDTVFSDVKDEFENVITPALQQVGQEIGQGLSVAGADILQGLEVAGQNIEDHPELIDEVLLTVALVKISLDFTSTFVTDKKFSLQ